MTILNFIIWNGSPEIFTIPVPFSNSHLTLRWYGLLFALGFLISQQILYYIFKKENKPEKDVDTLTIYMVVATIIGARLGHVLFYEPDRYLSNPIDILKIWEGGLASHGATIGILFALWLYARKKKPGQNYFQILDRIVILVALTGALIRLGNYFNSEIIGKPTDKPWGVVFVNRLTETLEKDKTGQGQIVDLVAYAKNDTLPKMANGRVPISIYIFCKPNTNEAELDYLVNGNVGQMLTGSLQEYFDQPSQRLNYSEVRQENGAPAARIQTLGIARHPAQLYESISCVFLFSFLFWIWSRYKEKLPQGRLFGIFLIVCFGLRFIYEFLKEPQVSFESEMALNMGQILSIPLVIAGIVVLIMSYRNSSPQNT